jgi:hydroxymethylpyrimidine kinase/phosphomethylpyrimidine kinase/thiamine-phosphate diphosphorylase
LKQAPPSSTIQVLDGSTLTREAAGSQAARCLAQGAQAALVHGVRVGSGSLHWLHGAHARGWVRPDASLPPISANAFERDWASWCERGFVPVDAALLALAGPHWRLPALSWDEHALPDAVLRAEARAPLGIYAIVDNVRRLRQVLDAGIGTVQLRIKQPPDADAAWHEGLRAALQEGIGAARAAGALLFINDHWRLAAQLGGAAVHLGQEDLLALGEAGRAELRATQLALGISSHAAWELCRARGLAPAYIACGPVWPTTTKDMPWVPQGLDNLAWWCRVAGTPVVAIGGILLPEQVEQSAAAGASGVCVLRGLGEAPDAVVPALQAAFARGRSRLDASRQAGWPHPTLDRRR